MSGTDPSTPYRPSPRPQFAAPTAIPYAGVTRHIWGDAESGEVFDWIYASSDKLHTIVFGLAPGGSFRHSEQFRTIFGADEVLHVLSGTMVLANPETGEVIRVPRGDSALFRADTWHHVFAHGPEPLRVLEFLSPPPATGSTGAYSRTRDYLDAARYADDSLLGNLPAPRADATLTWLQHDDVSYRLEGHALVGILASTENLTVATLSLQPGKASAAHTHNGDEVVLVTEGALSVRVWHDEQTSVFELAPNDGAYLPAGSRHEYRNYGGCEVKALVGVAPQYGE
ncbi:MAG: cupin domain-containing protein [Gaiellaceae bacterium]